MLEKLIVMTGRNSTDYEQYNEKQQSNSNEEVIYLY